MTSSIAISERHSLGPCWAAAEAACARWRDNDGIARVWRRDASLWTASGEDQWLGWLDAPAASRSALPALESIAQAARADGIRDVVVLGMGGSSLFPDVLARSFAHAPGAPRLRIVDSTDPAQIAGVAASIDLAHTLFVHASKSGGTIEPAMLQAFFRGQLERAGLASGSHFIAITDAGTALDQQATRDGFRAVAHGDPTIGGRFSGLSAFGVLPALLAGIDAGTLLARAEAMAAACRASDPGANPGAWLGLVLASAARAGRDKLTILPSAGIASFGGWLEQLVAESSGKRGRGIVPVDAEQLGAPECYADDRLFVVLRLAGEKVDETKLAALEAAGQPLIVLSLEGPAALGAEVFRWEFAIAVACAELGVNPFDQPDVEAAKVTARAHLAAYERGAASDELAPQLCDGELDLFVSGSPIGKDSGSLEAALRAHLDSLGSGDYFAINAFLPMRDGVSEPLQRLRHAVRDAKRVATTLGFGPRFQHSTGQLHKGGPASGVFLELTYDPEPDLAIPGRSASFGMLQRAQALGDFEVLAERERRALRIHVRGDLGAGLARIADAALRALRA